MTSAVVGVPGQNGWYTSDVTVQWTATTGGLFVRSSNGCDDTTITEDTGGTTLTCTVSTDAGSSFGTVTIKRDATPPTLNPAVTPNLVQVGGSATASANASDALSGIASQSCGAVDTATPGTKTVTCTATDHAGNTATAQTSYLVEAAPSGFTFTGFFAPVNNGVVNVVTAGRAIPIKFSLGGDRGLNIFASGSPSSVRVVCGSSSTEDAIEETVNPGGSSLSYDPATQQYTYVWKTERSWGGTCRQLTLKFTDGTERTADFRFNR